VRILVTGGAGFIGTNLVNRLVVSQLGDIVVVDNLSVGQVASGVSSQAEFVLGDFRDRALMSRTLRGVEVVVHLAALSGVIDSVIDPRPSFETNIAGSFQLLELACHAGVKRFIFASTGGAVLGDVTPPISETMAPSPLSPYGATKLAMEGYCSAFSASYSLPCAVLRFSNIYGPHSGHKKSVIAAFIKSVIREEPIVVYGDGTQQRDYLYVGDLVAGIETAIGRNFTGTFQLGSGRPTSLRGLIAALESIAGKLPEVRFEAARRGEVHSTWCDIRKAVTDFGFSAPTEVNEGVQLTWRWFRDNVNRWSQQKMESPSD
jgi:UDP-glucose 4-epimerase